MSFMVSRFVCVAAFVVVLFGGSTFIPVAFAQQPSPTAAVQGHLEAAPANYVLGPDDLLTLSVPDLEEISNKPVRIDIRGDITLPSWAESALLVSPQSNSHRK